MHGSMKIRIRPGRLVALTASIAAAAALLTGCSAGTTGSGTSGSSAPAALTGSCGTTPAVAPKDPDGIIASLPKAVQANYNGYPNPEQTSAYSTFAGVKKPWKIGLLLGANLNAFTASSIKQLNSGLATARSKGLVSGNLLTSWAADPSQQSPTQEVAGFQDLVRQGANAIIVVPLSGDALAGVVDTAGKNGVVTVSYGGYIPSKYAINVYQNPYLNMASVLSGTVKAIGGKGNVLVVRGLPILPIDPQQFDVTKTLLAKCPDIKIAGTVQGGYTQAGAKSAVLQWLTANPQPVAAVVQLNAMGPGVISAFQQSGRDVPPVTGNVAQEGDVAYLHDNASKGYKSYGTAVGGAMQVEAALRIAFRVLSGQEPKGTEFAFVPPSITPDNVNDWYKAGMSLNGTNEIDGTGQSVLPDAQLDALFNKPTVAIGG